MADGCLYGARLDHLDKLRLNQSRGVEADPEGQVGEGESYECSCESPDVRSCLTGHDLFNQAVVIVLSERVLTIRQD